MKKRTRLKLSDKEVIQGIEDILNLYGSTNFVNSLKYKGTELSALLYGLHPKESARVATIDNIDLLDPPLIIDEIALVETDRILVKNQINPVLNGVYVFNGESEPLTRAEDFDDSHPDEVRRGSYILVTEGDKNGGTGYFVSNAGTGDIVVGTDPIEFKPFSKYIDYTNGIGVNINGNIIEIDGESIAGNGLKWLSDQLSLGGTLSADLIWDADQKKFNVANASEVSFHIKNGTNEITFIINNDGYKVSGTAGFKGIEYGSDYSVNYTDRSLTEKKYVDTKINESTIGEISEDDKNLNPNNTSGDGIDTGLVITNKPVGMLTVTVNGISIDIGNGVKTDSCFFTNDDGDTARSIQSIDAGDKLYWNGVIAGYDLEETDSVDILYLKKGIN